MKTIIDGSLAYIDVLVVNKDRKLPRIIGRYKPSIITKRPDMTYQQI